MDQENKQDHPENAPKEAEIETLETAGTDKLAFLRKISTEMLMIFLIGFLFGIAAKTEFSKRINVVDSASYGKQGFDLVAMQKQQEEKSQAAEPVEGGESAEVESGSEQPSE